MKEIEKIKEYIEKHSDKLFYEIYGSGGFAENVRYEIKEIVIKYDSLQRPIYNYGLTVFHTEDKEERELFHVWENWFKIPSKKKLEEKIAAHINSVFDFIICHHWHVRTSETGQECFVLSALSLDDYIKSIELYKRVCADADELAYTTYLIEQLSLPLEDKIHSEYLTKEEFLARRNNSV